MRGWSLGWLALFAALLGMAAPSVHAAVGNITSLSSRPDRVSGGDVLIRISQDDDGATPVTINGADVTGAFRSVSGHTRIGLVKGLKLGANVIVAGGARLKVTNYPITGPITSGPHQTPFVCTTATFPIYAGMRGAPLVASDETFGPSLDADCSAATKITYLYLPKGGSQLAPLPSSAALPADVAMTTTTTGEIVRFIVRVETATIDRGIYQSTILFDPTSDAPPSWATPPKGWNRRLIAVQGAGCPGGWHFQGTAGGSFTSPGGIDASLYSVKRLGEGYALYGSTLQNASQDCNAVLEGEAAMMGKEHFIKSFGVPLYTVSVGCSGGSYGSAQPADALPGLYDGVLIGCTFPDPLAIALAGEDARLLAHYFDVTGNGAREDGALSGAQQMAISGYKNDKAFLDAANQSGRTDPVPGRADLGGYKSAIWSPMVPAALRYDPKTNPKGARPTIFDAARNIYGVDPATGFARSVFDNVGVEYGLAALRAGQITPAQFLDLNARIGGFDADANYVAHRTEADPGAVRRAYQSGLMLSGGGGLATIPVFDISGIYNDDGGYHYQWYHFALRERMRQANGGTSNHVMWRGNPIPFDQAWSTFIAWVDAIRATGDGVITARPVGTVDECRTPAGVFEAQRQTFSREPDSVCNKLYPSYGFPRLMAGGPLAANILKCRLKPIDARDYARFSPAELAHLRRIFPSGVCDWSKGGVGQVPVVPWASFGPAPENLVFDIKRAK
jgi:hypothetical protein